MSDIRSSLEAAVRYVSEHPEEARYTDSAATATLEEGLRVRVRDPEGRSVRTDMPPSVGGSDSAPSPGWLFRAALASCDATLIALRAAQAGIELATLEVMAESESDDRGILGIDEHVPAGPLRMRVRVSTEAPDAAEGLRSIIQDAVAHCPVHEAITRAVPITLEISGA